MCLCFYVFITSAHGGLHDVLHGPPLQLRGLCVLSCGAERPIVCDRRCYALSFFAARAYFAHSANAIRSWTRPVNCHLYVK